MRQNRDEQKLFFNIKSAVLQKMSTVYGKIKIQFVHTLWFQYHYCVPDFRGSCVRQEWSSYAINCQTIHLH